MSPNPKDSGRPEAQVSLHRPLREALGWLLVVPGVFRAVLRLTLRGRSATLVDQEPCAPWFAVFVSAAVSALLFSIWTFKLGLGAAQADAKGALFGLYGGAIWGLIFGGANTFVLWEFFYGTKTFEKRVDSLGDVDVGELFGAAFKRLKAFRPLPTFRKATPHSWAVFLGVQSATIIEAIVFCLITWVTEGPNNAT